VLAQKREIDVLNAQLTVQVKDLKKQKDHLALDIEAFHAKLDQLNDPVVLRFERDGLV
jgi:uncharacterized coiled-coil protein SlyX